MDDFWGGEGFEAIGGDGGEGEEVGGAAEDGGDGVSAWFGDEDGGGVGAGLVTVIEAVAGEVGFLVGFPGEEDEGPEQVGAHV